MKIPAIGRLPQRQHAHDAGADLIAGHEVTIPSGGRALVGTGLSVRIPVGMVGLVCPRSGLAARHGVTVLNAPGAVDPGYSGEIKVCLYNSGREPFTVKQGDRIAQLLVMGAPVVEFYEVESFLDVTERGTAGFGSTGVRAEAVA